MVMVPVFSESTGIGISEGISLPGGFHFIDIELCSRIAVECSAIAQR